MDTDERASDIYSAGCALSFGKLRMLRESLRRSLQTLRSAGFQTCCVADFQVGNASHGGAAADLETRDTADLEVGATVREFCRGLFRDRADRLKPPEVIRSNFKIRSRREVTGGRPSSGNFHLLMAATRVAQRFD
jgi:hypothetical protein